MCATNTETQLNCELILKFIRQKYAHIETETETE